MHYSLLDDEKCNINIDIITSKKILVKKKEEFENIIEIKRIQKHITKLLNIKLKLKTNLKIYK